MVTFDSGGGLGNRLFQYVLARLLAEKLGFQLNSPCPIRRTLTPTEPAKGKVFADHQHLVEENIHTENVLEKHWGKCHIHLRGYWQEEKYYTPNREKILSFFQEKAPETLDKENIVMHVRLTDYKDFGPCGSVISPQYYMDCLGKEKFDRLFIVTDAPDDPYLHAFDSYKPIITRGNEKKDFWFLTEFDRIIVGNSTFSWWAAFLSNATKVYTPRCWIRNSVDIRHELHIINNGRCENVQMPSGFLDY